MARSEPEIDVEVAEHPTPSTGLGPARGNVGRYRLTHELASGGMASVYLAFPELARSPGEAVAVKRVHPHLAVQRSFVEMFLDEARVAARIDHPNVARVLDIGAAEGGQFIAMELLLGRSLGAVAKRLKRLPLETRWPLAAHVVARAAEGLHAAHELRDPDGAPLEVVHRDVSPHNVFVTYDGRVKVVDFGIARARGRLHQTETGTVKGKFAYMAPEQMMGLPVDRRADVWALGVVLHELLVGDKLFKRSNDTETVLAVTAHRGLDPTRLPDGLPEALVDALRGALTPEPEARTPNAGALAEALDAVLAAHAPVDLGAAMQALFAGALEKEHERLREAFADGLPRIGDDADVERSSIVRRPSRPPASRRRWIALGLGTLGLLGVGVGALAYRPTEAPSLALLSRLPKPEPVEVTVPAAIAERPAPEPVVTSPPEAEPAPRARRAPAPSGRGTVSVATAGGWAEVYLDGRRLGTTPGRFTVPAGRHTLVLRPHGGTRVRRVPVDVPAGGTRRVRVELP
ncbi:MAG: serine/threonine-protein kinase [Sandaracinaceae bacterium]